MEFASGNINFLSFLNTERMGKVVEILPCGRRQRPVYLTFINTVVADDLVTQGSRASVTIVVIQFALNILVSQHQGADSIKRYHLTSIGNLHNGISYTGKMSSLYWIRAQKVWIKVHRSEYDKTLSPSRVVMTWGHVWHVIECNIPSW